MATPTPPYNPTELREIKTEFSNVYSGLSSPAFGVGVARRNGEPVLLVKVDYNKEHEVNLPQAFRGVAIEVVPSERGVVIVLPG